MEQTCINCNATITQNFCGACGQKKFKRIDKNYISDELQYTLLHTNKGFLYSIKCIIKNPGKTAKSFIDGERIKHYKPIALAFILSGISAYISHKIIHLDVVMKAYYTNQKTESLFNDYNSFVNSYNSLIMLSFIPILALFSKLCFKKWGHNYFEHVVMNAFGVSFYTLFNILLLYPILYIFKDNAHLVLILTSYAIGIIPFAMVWFFKNFYPEKSIKTISLRVLLFTIFVVIAFYVIIILAVIGYVVVNGPEALKHFN